MPISKTSAWSLRLAIIAAFLFGALAIAPAMNAYADEPQSSATTEEVATEEDATEEADDVELLDYKELTIDGINASYTYAGKAIEPKPTKVSDKTDSSKVLKAGTDYDLIYANNTNVGTATITVKGKGTYSDYLDTIDFDITAADLSKAKVTGIENQPYINDSTENKVKEKLSVKIGDVELKKDVDYEVSFIGDPNTKDLNATVTVFITKKGSNANFTGTYKGTYKVLSNLADLKWTWKSGKTTLASNSSTKLLTGVPTVVIGNDPTPTIIDNDGDKLKKGTDYTVTYTKNTKPGEATVTVKGKGLYAGGVTDVKYKVSAAKLSACTIKISNQVYKGGSAIKPNPSVKSGSFKFVKGSDYILTYKNNKKIGTATVTIKANPNSGRLGGKVTKTFKIVPSYVKNTSIKKGSSSGNTRAVKVKWSKKKKGYKYQVKYSTSSKFKNAKTVTVSKNKYTTPKLKKGKTVYVKVRCYKTVKGKKYYSAWTGVHSIDI